MYFLFAQTAEANNGDERLVRCLHFYDEVITANTRSLNEWPELK